MDRVWGGAGVRRALLTAAGKTDPLAGANVGDPVMGGYYVGIIDTTKGNIVTGDAYQTGKRYALIVSPKSLESSAAMLWRTSQTTVAQAKTRWDGLSATAALANTTYPAFNYCYGLAHPADSGSPWYLPAMDELELIYRALKPTTATNTVSNADASSFPGTSQPTGLNGSSDPSGAAYTTTNPAQTSVAAFRSTGAQTLRTGAFFWSATWYDSLSAWAQSADSGNQVGTAQDTTGSKFVRPVRRVVLV